MERPRVYKTEALVLKQMPIGEADRLLTLYTPYMGKIRAVARGIRRPKSKMAGHLEPLTHSTLMLARGRNLDIVSQAETVHSFIGLRDDLERLSRAIYLAELVDSFAQEDESESSLFRSLLETLAWLEMGEGDLLLRLFEMKLLEKVGYLPELYHCLECRRPLEPTSNFFSFNAGGVICPSCPSSQGSVVQPVSLNALKLLRFIHKSSYQEARKMRVSTPLGDEVKQILGHYIRHLLERELRSIGFLETVAKTPSLGVVDR